MARLLVRPLPVLVEPGDKVSLLSEVEQRLAQLKRALRGERCDTRLEFLSERPKLVVELTQRHRPLPFDPALCPADLLEAGDKAVHDA